MALRFKTRKEVVQSVKTAVHNVSDYKAVTKRRKDNYAGTPLREEIVFGDVRLGRHGRHHR